MILEEYFKVKESKNLSRREMDLFLIQDMSSGWTERYKNNSITQSDLEELCNDKVNITLRTRNKIKKFLFGVTRDKVKVKVRKQLLYLMVNENNRFKIGISEDPIKRAQALSTSSGYLCKCLALWEVDTPVDIEKELHSSYKEFRILGEWFSSDLPIDEVFNKLKQYKGTTYE